MRRGRFSDSLHEIVNALEGALRESAEAIADRARDNAPGDTGELRESIEVSKDDDLTYLVQATSDHAVFVEYGTEHQAAEPFLRPAFDAEEEATFKRLRNAMKHAK